MHRAANLLKDAALYTAFLVSVGFCYRAGADLYDRYKKYLRTI